jgi:cytochrome c biogenesis protein
MYTPQPIKMHAKPHARKDSLRDKHLRLNGQYCTWHGWKSWVNLQIVNDPGKGFALFGAILAILGLLISLFTRQRRIWVKQGRKTQVAGLAKNGIPGLEEEIADLIKEMSNER